MSATAELTDRQRAVLDTLRRLVIEGRGKPPTLRELMAALGVSSTNAVQPMLVRLQRAGLVRVGKAQARDLEVVGLENEREARVQGRMVALRLGAATQVLPWQEAEVWAQAVLGVCAEAQALEESSR